MSRHTHPCAITKPIVESDGDNSSKVMNYIMSIEDLFNTKIHHNPPELWCSCQQETPPDWSGCGKYPDWCLILKCRAKSCKGKKPWKVCIRCINSANVNKNRMYRPDQTRKHNEWHEALLQKSTQELDCVDLAVMEDKTTIYSPNVVCKSMPRNPAKNRSACPDSTVTLVGHRPASRYQRSA